MAYAQQSEKCSLEVSVRDEGDVEILRNPFGALDVSEAGGRVIKAEVEGLSLTGCVFEAPFSIQKKLAVLGHRDGDRWLYAEIPDAPVAEVSFHPEKPYHPLGRFHVGAEAGPRERTGLLGPSVSRTENLDGQLQVVRDVPRFGSSRSLSAAGTAFAGSGIGALRRCHKGPEGSSLRRDVRSRRRRRQAPRPERGERWNSY